jgi:hypothetical protein
MVEMRKYNEELMKAGVLLALDLERVVIDRYALDEEKDCFAGRGHYPDCGGCDGQRG